EDGLVAGGAGLLGPDQGRSLGWHIPDPGQGLPQRVDGPAGAVLVGVLGHGQTQPICGQVPPEWPELGYGLAGRSLELLGQAFPANLELHAPDRLALLPALGGPQRLEVVLAGFEDLPRLVVQPRADFV